MFKDVTRKGMIIEMKPEIANIKSPKFIGKEKEKKINIQKLRLALSS